MGLLISRFRRKQTTLEVLETIDKEINKLQRNRKVNQDRQKHIVTSLLIYSIATYVIAAVIFFCVYFPDTWQLRFLYSLPLLIFPFLIWGIKKLLHWYFVKRLSSNDLALQELRERKKQILEDVMETETYKRAREILEKFDPARLRKLEVGSSEGGTHVTVAGTPGTVIHQRTIRTTTQQVRGASSLPTRMQAPAASTPRPPGISAVRPRQPLTPFPSTPALPQPQPRGRATPQPRTPFPAAQPAVRGGFAGGYASPPGPPMPRSILPQSRGTMDRLMDYLVGDGPENRYALICQQCHSHNGMALREEYEYLSFRCCYCYFLNLAKKQRPIAPRLEFFAPAGRKQREGVGASNEESDDDDVDKEDDAYSDQDSQESDTSAGISPIQSMNTPVTSSVSGQNSKEIKDLEIDESKGQRSAQVQGQKPAEIKGSKLAGAEGSSSSVSPKPKRAEELAAKASISHIPSIRKSQVTKVQASRGAAEGAPVAELKDPMHMHATRVSQNEKSELSSVAQDKKSSEFAAATKEASSSNSLAFPDVHTAGTDAKVGPAVSTSTNTKLKDDGSKKDGGSESKDVSGSALDAHSSEGACART